LQKRVDDLGALFKAVVIAGRERPIDDEVMQGQSFDAETAKENGLIDGVSSYAVAMRETAKLGVIRAKGK
jgi:ClpP class serine protease